MDELLIEQVKNHEILYNHAVPEYRDQQIRQEAWEEIGQNLEIKAEKAKELWDKLRRCFCNAMNRRRDPASGMAIKKKNPWKYEEQMSFILPFLERRRTRIKVNDPERSEDTAADLEDHEEIEDADRYLVQEYISVEEEGVDALDSGINEPANASHETPNIPITHSQENVAIRKRKCEEKCPLPKPKVATILDTLDETDLFFLSLARMMKQLPKMEQTNIKMILSNAVLTAEIRCNQTPELAESQEWSETEKRNLLIALRKYGQTELTLIQNDMPHRSIVEIREMIDHYKKLAQIKWLHQENRQNDEIKNWIDILEKINSQKKGYVPDIIPRVLKYIALYEKKIQSDIDLRKAYMFLSEVSSGKSTEEMQERTGYFLYQCLVRLAENLQKQNIQDSQYYLKQLEDFEELLKNSDDDDEDEVNPLFIPEHLLHVLSEDFSQDVEQ